MFGLKVVEPVVMQDLVDAFTQRRTIRFEVIGKNTVTDDHVNGSVELVVTGFRQEPGSDIVKGGGIEIRLIIASLELGSASGRAGYSLTEDIPANGELNPTIGELSISVELRRDKSHLVLKKLSKDRLVEMLEKLPRFFADPMKSLLPWIQVPGMMSFSMLDKSKTHYATDKSLTELPIRAIIVSQAGEFFRLTIQRY